MARRHLATLVLAALALGLGACQAANASTSTDDSWHPPFAPSSAAAQPSSVPSTAQTPSKGPAKAKAPSPSPSRSELPEGPAGASPSDGAGSGPAGSLTTTGTSAVALTFDDGPDAYSMQVL